MTQRLFHILSRGGISDADKERWTLALDLLSPHKAELFLFMLQGMTGVEIISLNTTFKTAFDEATLKKHVEKITGN